jgi:hypothetical protein
MSAGSNSLSTEKEVDSNIGESNKLPLPIENPSKRPRFLRDSSTAFGPTYTLATEIWQSRLNAAASYTPDSMTSEGKRFTDNLSQVVTTKCAEQGLPIMFPADDPNIDEPLDGEWGATSNFVFALLQEKPNSMTARVAIIGYLHNPDEIQLHAGQHIVFATPTQFLTPRGINELAIKEMMSKPGLEGLTPLSSNRLRTSDPTIMDEEGKPIVNEKAKQSGLYNVLDLNGTFRPCSGKSDGVKRMNKVGGMIRLFGWDRFEKLVLDLNYNQKYFVESCQRYEESAADLPVTSTFKSLGKLNHISDLPVFTNKSKLDCVLLGTYPQYDRSTICLADFLRADSAKIQWKKEASRQGRVVLADALKNLEKVFEVFYGTPYRNSFATILNAFEDEAEIFDNYHDLYITIQLEVIISKFYSDIKYEKVPVIFTEMTMDTPDQCASLLIRHLHVGLTQARGTAPTGNWEKQPHSKFYSSEGTYKKIIVASPTISTVKKETVPGTILICPYHIAGQLGITSASGSAITCTTERCKNRHDNITKLNRNDVTKCIKTITVKRIREQSMAELVKYYKK